MIFRLGCAGVVLLLIFALSYVVGREIAARNAPTPSASMEMEIALPTATRGGINAFAAPRAVCNGVDDLNCSDFASGADAAAHLAACGDEDGLDHDGDGRACEGSR
jgi:hypothetical protein